MSLTWNSLRDEWLSDSPVMTCRTSGSTGTPKTIELPKVQMAASARRTLVFFGLDNSAHFHSCLAPDYIGGKMMMIRAMECGGRFTWEKPSNRPLHDYDGDDIDLLCVVPSQMHYLLQHIKSIPSIRDILVGGSPIPHDLRIRIAESGLSCWETYGMTETASHIAIRRVTSSDEPFRPLPGIIVLKRDGCLAVEIPGWHRFQTNDMVEITPDNGFRILGRSDNVIITGGLKVHPEQVELKLQRHFTFPLMITSRPDSKWGRAVELWVENPDTEIADIMATCHNVLAPHEVPKYIVVKNLPRTSNGKLKRNDGL